MASSSIIGVSSVYPPTVELSRRSQTPSLVTLFSDKSHFAGSKARACALPSPSPASIPRNLRLVSSSAIASPNSVLSEEAFKGFRGGFEDLISDSEGDEDAEEFEGEEEAVEVDKDELAVSKLGLPQKLVDALEKRGITGLFPIQRAVLVPAMEGRDLIARAKTGTGKTLAFGIPILKRLTEDNDARAPSRRAGRLPRVLVMAPTRELAKQVDKEMQESAPYLSTVCIYGGVSYSSQQNSLSRGVDIVVGTPGRLIDLIESNSLKLNEVQYLVLDEADEMLKVGFEEAVETILSKLPTQRQSMLFSATMPMWVKKLARKYLDNPLLIDLVGDQDEKLAEGIKLYAIPATGTSKRTILGDIVTVYAKGGKTIVFTQTKRDADEVSLALANTIPSEALHGDISQHQRERTLNGFRQGKFSVLVATDVASRGLDIPNVDLIIHYELPNDPETFVHRSGRTGRAGKEGTAIILYSGSQRRTVSSLERDVGCKFEHVSAPGVEEVLESSAHQVISTLSVVHPESLAFFTPLAEQLIQEQGTNALAAALAQLSGFAQPPSARSLITHEQGRVTLQLTRDSSVSRGFLSARSVMGFLSDVYRSAADDVGKILLIADERVQGAVFDLPEDVAKELLAMQMPPGNSISKIKKLPPLQDDGPPSDFYGKFSNRERSTRGGFRDRRPSGNSRGGWGSGRSSGRSSDFGGRSSDFGGRSSDFGGRSSDFGDDDSFGRGGRSFDDSSSRGGRSSFRSNNSRGSQSSRGGGDSWLIDGGRSKRSSSSSSFGSRDRSFGGACFTCGKPGHRASDCPEN